MFFRSRFTAPLFLLIALLFNQLPQLGAQSYRVLPGVGKASSGNRFEKKPAGNAEVNIELLYGPRGAALHAQTWSQALGELGYSVRIRQRLGVDKIENRERKLGTFRSVTVIGSLEPDGSVQFSKGRFRRSNIAQLKDWLKSIERFGAQGSPEGQPAWGLSQQQYERVQTSLTPIVTQTTKGKSLQLALDAIDVPRELEMEFPAATLQWLKKEFPREIPVATEMKGFSKGTALAIVLNQYGLGFHPQRMPGGAINLWVVPLEQTIDVWPVGRPFIRSNQQTAPALYKLVPIALNDQKVVDVLHAIEVKTKVPVCIDYFRIALKGIDIDALRITYPEKRTTWSLLLNSIAIRNKLSRKLRIDENGRPFVWITALQPGRGIR